MSAIIEFFKSISNIIGTLINLVISTITSLITLIINIPTYLEFIISSLNVLPTFLMPFMLAFISLIVVQYLLNRKAN